MIESFTLGKKIILSKSYLSELLDLNTDYAKAIRKIELIIDIFELYYMI